MLMMFPLYQLYLQIFRHHRHKRLQTQLQQVSDVKGWSLKYSVAMGLIAVADPDLQIRGRGGGSHPDPEIMGEILIFFSTFYAS